MKKLLPLLLIAGALGVGVAPTVSATDDDPCGSLHDFKVEGLSGKTFTVPTPPSGWTVEYVVLKVGGPGGGTHITFDPATAGQVLSVAYQQYDISHAHVCKSRVYDTTTTTIEDTTTTEATTTTVAETTTTTLAETTTTAADTTTTVVDETTTTVAGDIGTTTTLTDPTTTTVALTNPVAPTTTAAASGTTTTTRPVIPVTGNDGATSTALLAMILVGVGAVIVGMTRRPQDS